VVDAFITALETTLRELAGVAVVTRLEAKPIGVDSSPAIGAVIRLYAVRDGWLALSFSAATADLLARRVLAGLTGQPDAHLIQDCIAELLNVMAGQTKTLLHGTPYLFTLSTPEPWNSADANHGAGGYTVPFDSDIGPFVMQVCPAASTG
jgi:CheY-specific phosphatase CheX